MVDSGASMYMLSRKGLNLAELDTLYEQEIEQYLSQPNCQKLKTMVKRCIDQKIRARNFEARNDRIETGCW